MLEIIVEKGIKTRTELLALANEQKMEGKTDITVFVVTRGPKVVAEVLNSARLPVVLQKEPNIHFGGSSK